MTADIRAVPFWSDEEIEAGLAGAISHMRAHGVLAYPTETVYGFGGTVDTESVAKLIALKGRPAGKPFLLIVAASEMITRLGLILPTYASRLAAGFWPGPLTMVLPGGEKQVPEQLRGPEGGIAVRWTPHRGLTRLVQAHGAPITSTSANRPGVPPATNASQILEQWTDAVALGQLHVLDGGQLSESQPSTVVDCTGARARVIRPGAIPVATLRTVLSDIIGDN
ncbi:MAG TPA: L-threonylcarbamoyladenylate synthase [Gemmatimonadaceae bacterium]|nr:L-threonylcarbamoyladenylate synthase [Gemmatimonadaceae bacterium]